MIFKTHYFFLLEYQHYQNVTKETLIEFAKFGFLRMTINYDNLYSTLYEDKAVKTIDSIIGEIGGQLGLSGGISILNACEFIGILVSCCYNHMRHKKEIQTKARSNKNDREKCSQETTVAKSCYESRVYKN